MNDIVKQIRKDIRENEDTTVYKTLGEMSEYVEDSVEALGLDVEVDEDLCVQVDTDIYTTHYTVEEE